VEPWNGANDVPFPVKVVVDIAPASVLGMSFTLRAVLYGASVTIRSHQFIPFKDTETPMQQGRRGGGASTHLEWLVTIPDILKEVDLVLFGKQRSTNGVHRRIAPSLVVEPSGLVEMFEEIHVGLRSPELEAA
jgi:hypothetical protein